VATHTVSTDSRPPSEIAAELAGLLKGRSAENQLS
jgi:hypothetical protein